MLERQRFVPRIRARPSAASTRGSAGGLAEPKRLSERGFRAPVAAASLLVALCSGGLHAQSGVGPQAADSALAADTALLRVVIASLPRRPYHEMAFDPRVIKDDPNAVFIHPPADFAIASGPVVEARAAVTPRVNATRYGGDDYFACSRGPGGLGRADSAGLAMRGRGARRPYCVVAGVPRPGGPYFPAGGIDRRGGAPAGAYTVRVVTIDPGKYTVYDVVAERSATGWNVVETAVLFESWS